MNLKSGVPFWLIKNGLLFEYLSLDYDLNTDVVILGGGISGALAAYYLTEAGIECTVVDARSIGQGSTCASTALLQYEIDIPLSKLQKMIGYKDAVRAYEQCAEAIQKLETIARNIGFSNFAKKKSLYYAASKKDVSFLQEEYAIRKENGFDVSLLNRKEVKEEFHFDSNGAILSQLAAETDAYSFTHALHQYNIKKGCKVFDRTNIKKIRHSKGGVILHTEEKKIIKTKKLLYATGYEAVNFVKKDIVNLQSTFVVISEYMGNEREAWKDDVLIWNTDDPYLYMRTTSVGRIIVGGRDEPFYNPDKRDRMMENKSNKLEKDFKKLFPKIPFKRDYQWAGTFGTTKDGLPFIGRYAPLPNGLFSLGFGGNGITFSQVAAEINRDIILGKPNSDAHLYRFERV